MHFQRVGHCIKTQRETGFIHPCFGKLSVVPVVAKCSLLLSAQPKQTATAILFGLVLHAVVQGVAL